ncbi:MAG: galactokinase, partial [Bulleidia sp.]
VKALEHNSMPEFLKLVIDSGNSSFEYLQNVYASSDPQHQSLSVGLALSQNLLEGRGAWRVHGGGFAGTIQAFVPEDLTETYIRAMESAFGTGACYCLRIRNAGGYRLI